jgi:hypothetical protein
VIYAKVMMCYNIVEGDQKGGFLMYAVEFNTKIDQGSIKIPEQYVGKLGGKIKVIILAEQSEEKKISASFSALRINTKGYKFGRDFANER